MLLPFILASVTSTLFFLTPSNSIQLFTALPWLCLEVTSQSCADRWSPKSLAISLLWHLPSAEWGWVLTDTPFRWDNFFTATSWQLRKQSKKEAIFRASYTSFHKRSSGLILCQLTSKFLSNKPGLIASRQAAPGTAPLLPPNSSFYSPRWVVFASWVDFFWWGKWCPKTPTTMFIRLPFSTVHSPSPSSMPLLPSFPVE